MDKTYRPSPAFWTGLGSPQHYPSICHCLASISTCSFLQTPAGPEASLSLSFTPDLQPKHHRLIIPISRLVCGHWSRANTWETFSCLQDIQQTSPSQEWNVQTMVQEADPGRAEAGPTAPGRGTGVTQRTRGQFSAEGLS